MFKRMWTDFETVNSQLGLVDLEILRRGHFQNIESSKYTNCHPGNALLIYELQAYSTRVSATVRAK